MDKILLSKLSIGPIRQIERYGQGVINKVYKVTSSRGAFTLRVYRRKKPKDFAFEVALLNHLKRLPIPRLLKLGGKYYTKVGKEYAIMYSYMPGRSLKNFTNRQFQAVGEFIGKFHNQGKNFRWNKHREKLYYFTPKKIDAFESAVLRSEVAYINRFKEVALALRQNLLSAKLPSGPIHVDIKPANVLFSQGHLSGVLDFDNAYIGPYVLDLAKSMVWLAISNRKFDLSRAIAVYKGYSRKRKLLPPEYAILYQAVKYAFLSHLFVDFYKKAIGEISQNYFNFMAIDFYQAYKSFRMSKEDFYSWLY